MIDPTPAAPFRAGGQTSTGTDDLVVIEALTKAFDGRVVLDQVSLRVGAGTIVSIIGQSGGGKTTLMRCINLLECPDGGRLEVAGETIFAGGHISCHDLRKLRQRVGMVFQSFNLFPHLTAVENVILPQIKSSGADEATAIDTAVQLLRRVGLGHRATAYPDQMSGGEQQRVAIARALALKPAVLLFDEPTSSLDPESTGEVLRVMQELARDGMTMIIVTHELPFAEAVSDSVVFIDAGHIIEQGPPAQVLRQPTHDRTRAYVASYSSHFQGGLDEAGRLAGLKP